MSDNDYHVYPVNDLHEHVLEGTECPCHPRIEVSGGGLLIIHNAWDFREVLEWLEDGEKPLDAGGKE